MDGVARQNKLETPRDKDEVNKWEIRESDGWTHDPDTMVTPLTPKPTRKAEALTRVPSTITSSLEEDVALKEVALPRYRCVNCLLWIDKARTRSDDYFFTQFCHTNRLRSLLWIEKAKAKDKTYTWVSRFVYYESLKRELKTKNYIWISVRWKARN